MTVKQRLAEAIQSLPEETSMEDAVKWLYTLYKINRGMPKQKEGTGPFPDFWIEPTIEELAAEQGVDVPQPLERLVGQGADLWNDEDEFAAFIDEIRHRRHAA